MAAQHTGEYARSAASRRPCCAEAESKFSLLMPPYRSACRPKTFWRTTNSTLIVVLSFRMRFAGTIAAMAPCRKNGRILLANSNQWYFNKLVKIPCHKTPYRCLHRLNLCSQSSRSCAGPNIKVLKDKDLEFANSIRAFFLCLTPVCLVVALTASVCRGKPFPCGISLYHYAVARVSSTSASTACSHGSAVFWIRARTCCAKSSGTTIAASGGMRLRTVFNSVFNQPNWV
jgi:hypothetical protein